MKRATPGDCCYFFSKIFSQSPSKDFIRYIVENRAFTLISALLSDQDEIEVLEDVSWLKDMCEIEVDYAALFSVPSKTKVVPYESYYTDEVPIHFGDWQNFEKPSVERGMKGFIRGPSSSKVLSLYEAKGFGVDQKMHELPDHIGCELEFLGYLFKKQKMDQAHLFVEEHLGRWGETVAQDIYRGAKTDFYKKAALALKSFLGMISSRL